MIPTPGTAAIKGYRIVSYWHRNCASAVHACTMSERWWLKRDSGTNSVRMFVKPNEGGAEDKGLVELLMPGTNGGEINVGQ